MEAIQASIMAFGWASVAFATPPILGTLYYSGRRLYRTLIQYESYRR